MAWWTPAWRFLDETLAGWSKALQGIVAKIRMLRTIMLLAILAVYGAIVATVVWPEYGLYLLGGAMVILSVPLIAVYFVVSLPLRAKSLVRLIDQGYPANARELAIRATVRKMHDQSIETEEMLVETAWNEAKKAYRKYKARAERLNRELAEKERADQDKAGDNS